MRANSIARPAKRAGIRLRPWAASGLLAIALLGLGCRAVREPDLKGLYASQAASRRPPVVVIPGVLGSRLQDRDSGREIWPGRAFDLLTGRLLDRLALSTGADPLVSDRLVPGDSFFEAFGSDYYRTIVATLTGPGGYHCVPVGELAEHGTDVDCVLFSWDWRKDLVVAAQQLDATIRRLRELRADPTLPVDIVAHSAGGLVARYFVRFAAEDVLDREDPEAAIDIAGSNAVRRVILIGTPNYGSVSPLQGAIMGTRLGFASMRPELLATMPSLLELLPKPDRTWMIDIHGQRIDVDLYDAETWRRFRWSIFDPEIRERILATMPPGKEGDDALYERELFFEAALMRGRRFHRALSVPLHEVPTEFVVFGGDCDLTPARCLLEPGDGRVTKASLLGRDSLAPDAPQPGFFPISYAVFIRRGHAALPSDTTFRDNLLNLLLY